MAVAGSGSGGVMTCHPRQSRRNLSRTQDRAMSQEAKDENLPLRYRLYTQEGAYNIRCGGASLVREIQEQKPYRVERLPMNGEIVDFPEPPGPVFGPLALEVESR